MITTQKVKKNIMENNISLTRIKSKSIIRKTISISLNDNNDIKKNDDIKEKNNNENNENTDQDKTFNRNKMY
jgi:hypothetical protein